MRSTLLTGWLAERRALGVALAVAALAVLGGCGATPGADVCVRPETEEPTDYTGGSLEEGVYMTSDWDGELLHFPGGAFYRIHHGLGERPRYWSFYLSFERDGLNSGSLTQAAGNQAELKELDDQTLTVVNGSCAEYYLLAVVGSGDTSP
jgi:hypothetical protein